MIRLGYVSYMSLKGLIDNMHTRNLATMVLVCAVYLLVFLLIRRIHVPVEPILQTKRLVFVLYALELLGTTAQRTSRMDEMSFGFRN